MFASKPKPLLIVSGLLILLALLSTTSTLVNRFGLGRGQRPGFPANGGTGRTIQPGNNDNGGLQPGNNNTGNAQRFNQNRGGAGGAFGLLRTTGINFQVIGYITSGLTILGIVLALLGAFGVWKQKRWGLNLGMLIAFLFLATSAPGLFNLGGPNWIRPTITILTVLASIPVLVYGVLPSVRDFVS